MNLQAREKIQSAEGSEELSLLRLGRRALLHVQAPGCSQAISSSLGLHRTSIDPGDILGKFTLESLNEVVSKQGDIFGTICQ
jgi:hypothetical protein